MGIKITAYHYNTMCDTYGCAGMARISLAMDDTPGSLKHNICNECLEGIVAAAPLHMVLAREDVKTHIQAPPAPDTFTATSLEPTWGPSIIAKLIDTDTGKMLMQKAKDTKSEYIEADVPDQAETASIKTYNWQDLKKLARDLKIENCNSMKRDVLEAEILKRL